MLQFTWPGILRAIIKNSTITSSTFSGTVSATGAMGYVTGTGGAVTQGTSKATGVTLNKLCGAITTHAESIGAAGETGFTLTNSTIAVTDVVIVNIRSGNTANAYQVCVDTVAAGSCHITIANLTAGGLAETLIINFAVIKAVAA